MGLSEPRWKSITPSAYSWEQDGLNYIRERLPDVDPWRVWSNFEFIALDGTINEVDLLVLSPAGLFLIEIKSWPGMLTGDAATWFVEHQGRSHVHDNPLGLTDRKAKKLASLLRRQKAIRDTHLPFVEALVFLSHEEMRCHLKDIARTRVTVRDRENASASYPPGIIRALTDRVFDGANSAPRFRIDKPVAKAVSLAMEQAGIREANRMRRVGDYNLVELLHDSPAGVYQDWHAEHVKTKEPRRVRIYTISRTASEEAREMTKRAAYREYDIVKVMSHPLIPQVETPIEHDLGTALLFRVRKDSMRLDHLLAQKGANLGIDFKLSLMRQIAEAVKYAHEKKIYHRSLSPQSILVSKSESTSPEIQIFNWQTGFRDGSGGSTSRVTATRHIEELVEASSMAYVAPESVSDPNAAGEKLDAFSLGAIAYHVFSGKPPAESSLELIDRIREGAGLRISSVLDGAGEALQELVRLSTHPDTLARPDSIAEWLGLLEAVEEELTAPADETIENPLDAKKDDKLPYGYKVVRRLGKGSTATAFLVEKDGREVVLKLANNAEKNDRVRAEAETLKKLRHANIAEWFESVEMKGIAGFTMEYAGERDTKKEGRDQEASLADRIRKEGALQLELLERFGEDLLKAVTYLEQQGVSHRDIKPENIGIGPGTRREQLHLILFDFSLSNAPLREIHAGTPPYLDPYLPERKSWDSYAERYSAAMTLYEMATGILPKFEGDPSAKGSEIPIEPERFDPAVRERFERFYQKAFARQITKRFDNAEEMLTAWRELFKDVEQPANPTITREEFDLPAAIAQATPQTKLIDFALSTRAINALDRIAIQTVEDLLRQGTYRIRAQRGVGTKTRREILELHGELRKRFPDVRQETLAPVETPSKGDELAEPEVGSVDAIVAQLRGRAREQEKAERKISNQFLGADGTALKAPFAWRTQTNIARERGVTRANISAAVAKGRERWRKNASIRSVRDELVALLDNHGGVLTAREAALALLSLRGSGEVEPIRSANASAVLRAAVEAERVAADPRFFDRRDGDRILIARTGELGDIADRLGRAADRLAQLEPLASPVRVIESLREIVVSREITWPPGVQPLTDSRLAKLAVEASLRAALSAKGEIYPRGMQAERALNLASGALYGANALTVEEVQARVASRYPEADTLPRRPDLDRLLDAQNLSLRWDHARQQYVYERRDLFTEVSGSSSTGTILPAAAFEPQSEERVTAMLFEERLAHALDEGGFLVLTTKPRKAAAAEQKLVARFGMDLKNLDEIVINALREEARENGVEWTTVLAADGALPRTKNYYFSRLVSESLPRILARISESRTPLFANPGLLARYDRMDVIEKLRDDAGTRNSPVHGAWLLVASDGQNTRPIIDGIPVPIISASQWAPIPDAWIDGVLEGS